VKPLICAVTVVLFLAQVARAEAAPGTPLALLAQPRVQKELKLTDKQVTAVKGLAASVNKKDAKLADALDAAKKALEPEQLARLKEISYQARGGQALADAEVSEALKLTKKQKDEIGETWQDEEKKLKMLLAVARFRNAEAMRTFVSNHRKEAAKKMLGVLSDEQKKQFTKMQGKAFDVSGLDAP
jgi:hypothetical protein